jgi:hypothetical protein
MPRTKETRNFSGSIFKREVSKDGNSLTVFDARKRYKTADGENKEKFKRCRSQKEALAALINFENEIAFELKTNRLNEDELIEIFIKIREKKMEFSEFRNVFNSLQTQE